MQVSTGGSEERPLLTIAIPTYNRSKYLRQLLDSLRVQIRGQNDVSLLISDNASDDGTQRVVEEERDSGTTLDYVRNKENLGAEANFLQCYERATGKYLWIISDDDLLRPGTVEIVLSFLRKDEYDLVFIEEAGFAGDPAEMLPKASSMRATVCTHAEQFLRRVHIFTTLISCNIINKDRVEAIGHKPFSTLMNSGLPQLGWTFTALRYHRKSLYIPDKLVYYRLANAGGYGVCQVFGTLLEQVTREWLAIPRLNDIVVNASLQRQLPAFIVASRKRALGAFTKEDPHALLSGMFRNNFRYWLFIYPLVVLPARIAQVWLQFIRVFNRIDRAFGYPSLSW